MNIQLNSGNIVEIRNRSVMTLAAECASQLVAERGTLWITDTRGQDDWLLEAGQSYSAVAGTTIYVEAIGDGAVRLLSDC